MPIASPSTCARATRAVWPGCSARRCFEIDQVLERFRWRTILPQSRCFALSARVKSQVVSFTLSPDERLGLWSRVAGDVLDLASLMPGLHPYNPRQGNVKLAQAVVIGVTALDVMVALAASSRGRSSHRPQRGVYRGRSGFPKGLNAARGAARTAKHDDALTGRNEAQAARL